MKKLLLAFWLLLLLPSCSKYANDILVDDYINDEALIDSSLLIDHDKFIISEADAENISLRFLHKESKSKVYSKSAQQLTHVNDSKGNPILYIINYDGNNGFVIISATKNYQPILAYSDNGSFDLENLNPDANDLLKDYENRIREFNTIKVDSLRQKYALNWSLFEKPKVETNSSKAIMGSLKDKEMARWQSLGYECHSTSAAYSFLDPTTARRFIDNVCANTDRNYNCSDNFLVVKRIVTQKGPLMQTAWQQRGALAVDAPNGLAGCVPIAIAQIMRYHQWPNSYNWAQIPINIYSFTAINPETKRFILDVRRTANVKYESDGTSSTIENARDAFNKFNYTTSKIIEYYGITERQTVGNEVMAGRPVYMSGRTSSSGHAWVCDGYKQEKVELGAVYVEWGSYLYTLGPSPSMPNEYLHMNWGWGEAYSGTEGWFYKDYVNPIDYDFSQKRKILLIKPNK